MQTRLAYRYVVTISVIGGIVACGGGDSQPDETETAQTRTIGHVERLHPDVDAIVPEGAVFEILAEGHEWTEGPVWVPELQSVLYSDIPNNAVYRWQEGVEEATEVLLVIKTHARRAPDLTRRLAELHSYEVPEILVLPVAAGLGAYLEWIREETEPVGEDP